MFWNHFALQTPRAAHGGRNAALLKSSRHLIKGTYIVKIRQRNVKAFEEVCHFVFMCYVTLFTKSLKTFPLLRLAATAGIHSWCCNIQHIQCVVCLLPAEPWNYCCYSVHLTCIYYGHLFSFINDNDPFLVTNWLKIKFVCKLYAHVTLVCHWVDT